MNKSMKLGVIGILVGATLFLLAKHVLGVGTADPFVYGALGAIITHTALGD